MASELDDVWAAGLFEGEGSAGFRGRTPTLHLAMTDEEIVRRFHAVIGCGTVTMPKCPNEKWNQAWWWAASGTQLEEVIPRLWPHLGTRRRRQIMKMFEKYDVYLRKQQVKRTRICERCSTIFLSARNVPTARWCPECWQTSSWRERKERTWTRLSPGFS